jgi:3-oxoacyl-[acyl-carrier protein] reductase
MFNLTGKTALITGASGGIGIEIAKALHKQGAIVGLAYFSNKEIETFAKTELKDRYFLFGGVDLTNEESLLKLANDAEITMGKIDILVNNAGITKDALSVRMKKESWDAVISLNLTSLFLLSQAVLTKMMRQKFGRVINITSIVGLMGNIGQANYSASKGGVIALGKTLAREFASRNITVNSIAPGFVKTKMLDSIPKEQLDAMVKNIPIARLAEPSEIAAAVVFLASDESAYITGQTLSINGGMHM